MKTLKVLTGLSALAIANVVLAVPSTAGAKPLGARVLSTYTFACGGLDNASTPPANIVKVSASVSPPGGVGSTTNGKVVVTAADGQSFTLHDHYKILSVDSGGTDTIQGAGFFPGRYGEGAYYFVGTAPNHNNDFGPVTHGGLIDICGAFGLTPGVF